MKERIAPALIVALTLTTALVLTTGTPEVGALIPVNTNPRETVRPGEWTRPASQQQTNQQTAQEQKERLIERLKEQIAFITLKIQRLQEGQQQAPVPTPTAPRAPTIPRTPNTQETPTILRNNQQETLSPYEKRLLEIRERELEITERAERRRETERRRAERELRKIEKEREEKRKKCEEIPKRWANVNKGGITRNTLIGYIQAEKERAGCYDAVIHTTVY